jgi:hypothetical protein
MKSAAFNQKRIRQSAQRVLSKLKELVQDRLRVYIEAIVNKLFNPEVALSVYPTYRALNSDVYMTDSIQLGTPFSTTVRSYANPSSIAGYSAASLPTKRNASITA